MHLIRSVLEDALIERKYAVKMREHLVSEVWGEVVGEHISRETQPKHVREGKLFVSVSTPAWLRELESMQQMLMKRLNERVGENVVKEIHFSLGDISPPGIPTAKAPHVEFSQVTVDEDDQRRIKKELSSVGDPQLRERRLSVMMKDAKLRKFRSLRDVRDGDTRSDHA